MQGIQVMQPGQSRERFHRRPNFPMAGTLKPFGLYPTMVHPVLPGETLKSATTRWSVVSQPLKNPLAGAWLESWFFYVKLTDIDPELSEMFISDTFSSSSYERASDYVAKFSATGQIDWINLATNAISKAFFINEGEGDHYMGSPDFVHKVKLNIMSWYQNMMFEPSETSLDTSGPRDAYEQLTAWQMLQQMQMTELTYERYLEQYGVRSVREVDGRPEILRYSRSWVQPKNHIDPTDGSPSSAWVWTDEVKLEKDKRFQEPGFIVQMACIRPKMYQKNVLYSMVGNLWGFADWFPAYNLKDPTAGIKNIGTTDVVFEPTWNAAEGDAPLLYDHRDLLSHGEQFINDRTNNPWPYPFASQMSGLAAAEPYDVRGEYASDADVDALFTGETEATRRAQYDGITSLVIAGHVQDTTR